MSALVCAIYIGKRVGYPTTQSPAHNLVLSFIGACLLWVAWFGFNAGSALSAGGLATSAFVATHFAAASGALGWMAAEWSRTNYAKEFQTYAVIDRESPAELTTVSENPLSSMAQLNEAGD